MGVVSTTNGDFCKPRIPKKGDVIRGKYQVVDYIGEGGMGVVMLAYHIKLRQHVALKMLVPELWEDRTVVARFEREGRAAARMRGIHVARVYDVEATEQGLPFLVMERLQGEDLASKMSRVGKLPVHEAVSHVFEACEGLAEAHARGVIHRDLKPENLYLAQSSDGSTVLKLLDFGISKLMVDSVELEEAVTLPGNYVRPTALRSPLHTPLLHEVDVESRLTSPQAFIGTVRYMAPEQVTAPAKVDKRTDIWALGVILFELLAGHVPFQGSTSQEVLRALASNPVPDLSKHGVPVGLTHVIARCLRKAYGERYVDVHELAQALAPFAGTDAASRLERIAHLSGKSAAVEATPRMRIRLKHTRQPVALSAGLLIIAAMASWWAARRPPILQLGSLTRSAQAAVAPFSTHIETRPLLPPSVIVPSANRDTTRSHPRAESRVPRNPLHVQIKR